MNARIQKQSLFFILSVGILILSAFLNRPVESAKRYQYQVISVTGMSELRTQSDVDKGRVKTIEKIVNDQAAQGWELYQADGYVLYFRR
jgi:Domain of unknown function (DUF4177)